MTRTKTPDEVVAFSERALRLKRLTEYPEWAELVQVLAEREQLHAERLTKRLMRGSLIPQEEVLKHVGFWEGVRAVLKTPGAVEKRLEKMLETAANGAQPEEGET